MAGLGELTCRDVLYITPFPHHRKHSPHHPTIHLFLSFLAFRHLSLHFLSFHCTVVLRQFFVMFISSFLSASSGLAMLLSGVNAAPHVQQSHSLGKRDCDNSATDRSCWGEYSTSTNYYDEVPDTGVTVEVSFKIRTFAYYR